MERDIRGKEESEREREIKKYDGDREIRGKEERDRERERERDKEI